MSYTTHPDSLFDVGKPILGMTHQEARDNLTAVAAGDDSADTAPRVQGKALGGISIGTGTFTGTSGASWTGLAGHGMILVNTLVETSATPDILRVRFSDDDGASWGSWQNSLSLSGSSFYSGHFRVSLQTGAFLGQMIDPTNGIARASSTLTVPSGANALSLSWNVGVNDNAMDLFALGGIE